MNPDLRNRSREIAMTVVTALGVYMAAKKVRVSSNTVFLLAGPLKKLIR